MPKCQCCGIEFEESELQEHEINYGNDLGVMIEKLCIECVENTERGEPYEQL